ncbi:MAG: hypothetical protein NZ602_06790 [Thermoguttaceae bacterium]|nr:hypothetical protein [Thermoguttaceae bacterium]MDW8038290.1 hypothetical protein [Thermoguttaceae bacterium]
MQKVVRRLLWVVGTLVACGLLIVLCLWLALRHVPAGYRRLVTAEPTEAKQASDEMVRRILALRNALARPGKWQSCFSQEHLNGWFAVDMLQNHPGALPAGWSDPRVQIGPEGIVGYCRWKSGIVDCVVSIHCEISLLEPNLLALRIRRLRAGALPVPLIKAIDRISQLASQRQIRLEWSQADNAPVALIRLDFRHPETGRQVQVESLQIQEDAICLAGHTK